MYDFPVDCDAKNVHGPHFHQLADLGKTWDGEGFSEWGYSKDLTAYRCPGFKAPVDGQWDGWQCPDGWNLATARLGDGHVRRPGNATTGRAR
jgi:hypothetical protein